MTNMAILEEQPVIHFNLYPPLGPEDWEYTFAVAQVRTLEEKMLSIAFLTEMTNASGFEAAVEMLGGTEYAISSSAGFEEIEQLLCGIRGEVRDLFKQLTANERVVEFMMARTDFANMRLAIRRLVLEKPLGMDYCDSGNISVDEFEQVFEQEDYSTLPVYLQEGVDAGVLGYYKNKNVRDIDIAIDKAEAQCQLENAKEIGSVFLLELQKMYIDLNNIRTMLRVKFTQSEDTDVFMPGGYMAPARFIGCMDVGYETIPQAFLTTPYGHIVEAGAGYLRKENSFLKLEAACDEHLLGFLKTTREITAGYQPIIAYLLAKEHEIRMVRMLLTAKRNSLEPGLILDRLVA